MIVFQRYAGPDSCVRNGSSQNDDGSACLEIRSVRQPGATATLRYRLDERSSLLRLSGWWLYVATPLGLACYPELRALLANAETHGLQGTLESLEDLRLAAFVAFNEVTEHVFFGRSLDGFCSLYFGGQGSQLVVSDSRLAVAKLQGPIEISKRDEDQWCKYARLSPEGSFFEGVRRCFAGVRYDSGMDGTYGPSRGLMAPRAQLLTFPDSIKQLHRGLLQAFSSYGSRRVALRLSGGVDSRVLLVGLLEAVKQGILRKDQILCVSVLYPGLRCDETSAIARITEIAGFEFAGVEATHSNVEAAYNECMKLPGPQYPTSFMGVLCRKEAKNRGSQILISGHGGDEIFDYDTNDILALPFKERCRRLDQIRALRKNGGAIETTKAILMTLFGTFASRSINSALRESAFSLPFRRAHRAGSRLAMAMGCGYELYVGDAEAHDMLIDAPLIRAQLWAQLAPWDWADETFKAVAIAYMERYCSEIARVQLDKVVFNDAVREFLPPVRNICELVDDIHPIRHASATALQSWRENLRL